MTTDELVEVAAEAWKKYTNRSGLSPTDWAGLRAALSAARPLIEAECMEKVAVNGSPQRVIYTNWRGETSEREIHPLYMWFGATEWHPEPQWIITAKDLGKGQERDFALSGFGAAIREGG